VTETSKVVDVLLPLGRKQQSCVQGHLLCLHYTLCLMQLSVGPDGFNGMFLKKCWNIVKDDFHELARGFYEGSLNLQNINGAYITLVPKCNSPEGVNDFRPISLTNVCLKFLTKLVANRLHGRILDCIHKNQYGFLKARSIQDCIA
jgi:hypothetical protein